MTHRRSPGFTRPLTGLATLNALALAFAMPVAAQDSSASSSQEMAAQPEVAVGPSLPGAFFIAPQTDGPHPAIILLGGSEGGDFGARRKAPLFLAQGYAVLGLPYYSPAYGQEPQFPDLPQAFDASPVDSLEVARDWLRKRGDVRPEDIGIYGVSKGAELALLAGSYIDGFAAIAAIVPSEIGRASCRERV